MASILITGGTGTLGKALVKKFYSEENKITIISRDENKQKAMAKTYPNITYVIADICNKDDLYEVELKKWDLVFHCAAMKHIDTCEANVHKCVETNYYGTKNVFRVFGPLCKRFVYFTTDKAVAPINAYGHAKALGEKYLSRFSNVVMFRWGNILGSTGSFLKILYDCAVNDNILNVTDPYMSRFWIRIESAVEFVMSTLKQPEHWIESKTHIPNMVSSTLETLIEAMEQIVCKDIDRRIVFSRAGEKQHEVMLANYEGISRSSNKNKADVEEIVALIRPIVEEWQNEG